MAHCASHLIGNYGECWIARGRWGGWKEVTILIRTASTRRGGGRERERERASDARGWNSVGQGREVLTFVNGRRAEFCA